MSPRDQLKFELVCDVSRARTHDVDRVIEHYFREIEHRYLDHLIDKLPRGTIRTLLRKQKDNA